MKVATVVGARPQFIKAAPVQRALQACPEIHHTLIHTGQHFDADMSDVFFDELGLAAPDHHLGIRAGRHGEMTGAMLSAIETVLVELCPEWVLVYGDTNSTVAAALAAAKLPVRLAHVEAGLRSFNRSMPEEVNRVITDHLSDVCFAPTAAAVANLSDEGIRGERVVRAGDVMFDAVRLFGGAAPAPSAVLPDDVDAVAPFVLATIHRAENTDDPHRLAQIVEALDEVATQRAVVLPLHPRTAAALRRHGLEFRAVHAVGPVGYLEMLALEGAAAAVVTDSGGVQKEAFFQRTPCVTLRTETEWVELVEHGWNRLADPADARQMVKAIEEALAGGNGADVAPYGDGHSAEHIVATLVGR